MLRRISRTLSTGNTTPRPLLGARRPRFSPLVITPPPRPPRPAKHQSLELEKMAKARGLPTTVKQQLDLYKGVEDCDLMLAFFWQWYSTTPEGKDKVKPDGSPASLNDSQALMTRAAVDEVQMKVINYWKNSRRCQTLDQGQLEFLSACEPEKLFGAGWDVFIRRFTKVHQQHPGETFTNVMKEYIKEYNTGVDLDLYTWCRKQLREYFDKRDTAFRVSKHRQKIADAANKKRETKRRRKEQEAQLLQANQTNTGFFQSFGPHTPTKMSGRALAPLCLINEDGSSAHFALYPEDRRFSAVLAIEKEIAENLGGKVHVTQRETDYQSDPEHVAWAKKYLMTDVTDAIDELDLNTDHLSDQANLAILHSKIEGALKKLADQVKKNPDLQENYLATRRLFKVPSAISTTGNVFVVDDEKMAELMML